MYLVRSETRLVYSIESNDSENIFSIISILMILCDIEFYKRQPQTKPNEELCISLQYISHSSLNGRYNKIPLLPNRWAILRSIRCLFLTPNLHMTHAWISSVVVLVVVVVLAAAVFIAFIVCIMNYLNQMPSNSIFNSSWLQNKEHTRILMIQYNVMQNENRSKEL